MPRSEKRNGRRTDLFRRLEDLSRNLACTWEPAARRLWDKVSEEISPSRRSAARRNPVRLLRSLTARARARLEDNAEVATLLRGVERTLGQGLRVGAPGGFSHRSPVAYFSMEFGLHESLPIYAGGLGALAGDHLKSASNLSLPLVGVGLIYWQGYFRQELDREGRQVVAYPRARAADLPIEVVHDRRGRELRVPVELPGRDVVLRVWKVQVGKTPLYLLDADVPRNKRADRAITDRLYVGSRARRIEQEIVAGIGGVRALRAMEIDPGAWHLNEGHVVLLALERMRELRKSARLDPHEALEAVASNTVFTTHTPVPEGNEVFELALAERYLRVHAEAAGWDVHDFLSLGLDSNTQGVPVLSLTVLALRCSRFRNGVSELHGTVARRMWRKLWPGLADEEIPITSVTNGVHVASWVAPELDDLYRRHLGDDWSARVDEPATWRRVGRIPAAALWRTKQRLKERLVSFVRAREAARLRRCGWSEARVRNSTDRLLDPSALTIGFARRFALYKRADLIFRDLKAVESLFASRQRPVQIIFAGKPHPEDPNGKALFERVARIARKRAFRGKVVLLENYDFEVARHLVQGVDLWLNNPRRPLEASGTSGQKVPVNAGLNLSVLDGWWCEGYSKRAGWAIGDGEELESEKEQDAVDHRELLRVLRREIVPLYYLRDARGIPQDWIRRVKGSMPLLVPRFSARRMVREYADRLYRPALDNGHHIRGGRHALAKELASWGEKIDRCWPLIHVSEADWKKGGPLRGGTLEIAVYLAGLDLDDIAWSDTNGDLLAVEKAWRNEQGISIFRIDVPGRGGVSTPYGPYRLLRLFALHPEHVHPQEAGRSVHLLV